MPLSWQQCFRSVTLTLLCIVGTAALPARAAEQIYFSYAGLDLSVSVDALATFAQTGVAEAELAFYLEQLTPPQRAKFRDILRARARSVNFEAVDRVFRSPMGQRTLTGVAALIAPKGRPGDTEALRTALANAAADPQGLSLITMMRQFPGDIQLNTPGILALIERRAQLTTATQTAVTRLEHQAATAAAAQPVDVTGLPDLQVVGPWQTQAEAISLRDPTRDRQLPIELYRPVGTALASVPVLVISHSFGAGPYRYRDLAQHLSSHGFAVVIPEHPGSAPQQYFDVFGGQSTTLLPAAELIDRPRDITFVLNQLTRLNPSRFQGQLNLQRVGILGDSYGGPTALLLAGAQLDFQQLAQDCQPPLDLLNLSLLFQCPTLELPRQTYQLRDPRVQALFVLTPFSYSLFGAQGLRSIQQPVFWQIHANDQLKPFLSEQVPGFAGLRTASKYLGVVQGDPLVTLNPIDLLTRVANAHSQQPAPGSSAQANPTRQAFSQRPYIKALTLAFFRAHLTNQAQYRRYLHPAYAQALSDPAYQLLVVRDIR